MKAGVVQEVEIFDPYEHTNFYPDSIDALRVLNVSGISDVRAIRTNESVAVDGGTLDSLLNSLSARMKEPIYHSVGERIVREVEWFRFTAAIDPPVDVGTKSVTVELYPGSRSFNPPFERNIHIGGMFTTPEATRTGLRSLGELFPETYFPDPPGALYIFGFGGELEKAWELRTVDFHSAKTQEGKIDYQKLLALEEQVRQGDRRIAEIVFPPLAGLGLVPRLTEDVGEKTGLESFEVVSRYWVLSTCYHLRVPKVHVRLNGIGHNREQGSGFVVEANYMDSTFGDVLTGGVLKVTSKEKQFAENNEALAQLLEVCNARFAQ